MSLKIRANGCPRSVKDFPDPVREAVSVFPFGNLCPPPPHFLFCLWGKIVFSEAESKSRETSSDGALCYPCKEFLFLKIILLKENQDFTLGRLNLNNHRKIVPT